MDMTKILTRQIWMSWLLWYTNLGVTQARTLNGIFRTSDSIVAKGQYIASFAFHGDAEIRYRINTTGNSSPRIHLIQDLNWQQALDAETCREKLSTSELTYVFTNVTGFLRPPQYSWPRIWHILYSDGFTCDTGKFKDDHELIQHNFIQYTLYLYNPDSIGNPRNHFSDEEAGLFRFYQLLTLGYFILGCIYGPRLYESLRKEGPMYLVIQLLSTATALQAIGSFSMMLYLRGYSKDGIGPFWAEPLSEFFDVLSQFVMLYMLLSLSLGWTLTGTAKPTRSFRKLGENPAAKIIALIGILQAVLFIWEQHEERVHRMYHAHRSYSGVCLALVRVLLAGLFAGNLYQTVRKERSALKKEFYSLFTKCTMLWFLCYPALVVFSWIFPAYLRFKLVTMSVVFCQSAAIITLFQLFLSRSLYWEISALSSSLPLRIDKNFSIKIHS